jgi:acyl-CoA synthetase (AMP-forming)/AMP-acid ligase II
MLEMIRSFETAGANLGLFLQKDAGPNLTFLQCAEIYGKIAAYMEYFRDCGIGRGARVIFPFETNEAVIVSLFSLIGMGAIPLSVKPYAMGVPKESYLSYLAQIFQQYRATHILDVPSIKNLELLPQRLPFPQENIQHTREPAFAKIASSDIAFVQFSSGSTSFPKGIPVTHGNLTAQLQALVKFSQKRPDDIIASWLPLYHDMGLIGTFMSSLYVRHNLHLASPMQFLINPLESQDTSGECLVHSPRST